jgi:hypothetical protein
VSAINLALKIGSQLIEARLQKLAADPISVYSNHGAVAPVTNPMTAIELPTTNAQKKMRSAKVHIPRVITVR